MIDRFGLSAVAVAGLLAASVPAHAQTGGTTFDVDGDPALRCAVSRAVELSNVDLLGRVIESVGVSDTFDALSRGDAAWANPDHIGLLKSLGVVGQDGTSLTSAGQMLTDIRSSGVRAVSTSALTLNTPIQHDIALPGTSARFSLSTGAGGTLRIVVSPQGNGNAGCSGDFAPVVRATLPGATGIEHVARGVSLDRGVTLYLYDTPADSSVDIAVNDIVGAPGSFSIVAEPAAEEPPFEYGSEPYVVLGDGSPAYLPVEVGQGESAVVALSISYDAWEPWFAVTGLGGAQPGVRIYETDGFGGSLSEPVFRSSYLPNGEAHVDMAEPLFGGEYLMVIEDLQRNAGTFLLEYSSDGFASQPRLYGDLYLNEETLQSLGSDLAFAVEEQGWYYFSTTSYDDVDPIMSLLDAEGWFLYESDDDAFSLNPLIIAELEPGDYTLSLDGFDGAFGEVHLSAYRIEPTHVSLETLGMAQQISDDYTQAPANVYIIDGAQGKLVDFDVDTSASGFDSTLAFYDTWDMSVWVSDDDGGIDYGSRVVDTFEGSELIAVVAGFNGERGGQYDLTVVDHAIVEGLPASAAIVEPGGPPVAGFLPLDGDIAWVRMPALAEGWYDIEVTSDLYYFRVDLYLYEEGVGYSWYDGSDDYEGEVYLSTNGDGVSDTFILVRNTSGEGGGAFEVSVR
jgi:hypothetical protein